MFSDPPIATWIVNEVLNSKLPIVSWVSALPQLTKTDPVDLLKGIVQAKGIHFFRPQSLHSPDFHKAILDTKPTIIAAMTFLRKIPSTLLKEVPLGGINCHPALLPKYRGSIPYFWSIYNGDKETGATIHEMTDEFDAGDIYASEKVPIDPQDTTGILALKCTGSGIALLLKTLREFRDGKSPKKIPQDSSQATYAPMPTAAQLEIDWTSKAAQIEALIRAASPAMGAYTFFRNMILKIWSAKISRPNQEKAEPGTLVVSDGKVEVATSDHLISLGALQLDLLRFYAPEDFSHFPNLKTGEKLGRK